LAGLYRLTRSIDLPASTCETCVNPAFAWNHGDVQPEIAGTWLGFVGPGVLAQGAADSDVSTDHAGVRPTILALLGLRDVYLSDGRVITQALQPSALADAYKQINAPFGSFGGSILAASTRAWSATIRLTARSRRRSPGRSRGATCSARRSGRRSTPRRSRIRPSAPRRPRHGSRRRSAARRRVRAGVVAVAGRRGAHPASVVGSAECHVTFSRVGRQLR
jgi:hypothetical protein